jgi:hypothetical protein
VSARHEITSAGDGRRTEILIVTSVGRRAVSADRIDGV